MATQRCPTCDESESLRGRPVDDDIELTCLTCDTTWLRGPLACRGCGRLDSVSALQLIRRTTRGNQLAIVGRKELKLCPVCDEAMVTSSLHAQSPVPEDYTSIFISGFPPPPTERPPSPPEPAKRHQPTSAPVPTEAPTPPARSTEAATERPTVRQATERFLSAQPDHDSTALIMLGAHLGPARRLADLKGDDAADELADWFTRTYRGAADDRRETARGTIIAIVDHWLSEKWLPVDLARQLR